MASLSEKLRRERELRGISLKQISDDTKIGVRFLEALEEDRIELIPGEFYRRSYLRAYARYLGLDEDRAVNAYAFAHQGKPPEDESDENPSRAGIAPWVPLVLAAGVVALGVLVLARSNTPASSRGRDVSETGASTPKPGVANASSTGEPALPDDGAVDASAATSSPSSPDQNGPRAASIPVLTPTRVPSAGDEALRLVVTVGESCWLEIEADGEVVTTGLKEEGFRGEFTADREVRLWLGNAGGVSLWVNDRPLRSLGRPGQVRKDLAITPDNFMDFVSAQTGPS